ncbi:MAG: ABC transporter ATP-binding protein, partial [Candidatus Moranbacteria bacterium]|nr:ABC transporter ATP-binding protein [Candidatus Moranbacteria bacterium]
HANRDILLMDEVLAVGDANFQQKCLEEFNKFRKQGKTVILVTHDMGTIQRYCDRAMLLHNGKIELIGQPLATVEKYVNQNMRDEEDRIEKNEIKKSANIKTPRQKKTPPQKEKIARIAKVEFLDKDGKPKNIFSTGDDINIRIHYQCRKTILKPVFGIAIYTQDGINLGGPNTRTSHCLIEKIKGRGSLDFTIIKNPFFTGAYDLTVTLYDWECINPYDIKERTCSFKIFSKEENQFGIIKLNHLWGK